MLCGQSAFPLEHAQTLHRHLQARSMMLFSAMYHKYVGYEICAVKAGSRGSSVSIVSGYGLDDRAIEVRSPREAKSIFPLASVFGPALGPTQPPVQWVPGVKCGRGVTLTNHPLLVSRL
jgi:hypothetical protein